MFPWDRVFHILVQYGAGRSLRVIRHEDISLKLARSNKPEDFQRLVAVQFAWIWEDTLRPAVLVILLFIGYLPYHAYFVRGFVARILPFFEGWPDMLLYVVGAIYVFFAVSQAMYRRAEALAHRWVARARQQSSR